MKMKDFLYKAIVVTCVSTAISAAASCTIPASHPENKGCFLSFTLPSPDLEICPSMEGAIYEYADRGEIWITTPELAGMNLTNLIAQFSTASVDAQVTVNGVVQESGVTANDFSGVPLVYEVVEGDTSRQYAVRIDIPVSQRPFPQTVAYKGAHLTSPNINMQIIADYYRDFKKRYILPVKDARQPQKTLSWWDEMYYWEEESWLRENRHMVTVSESHGYGMLLVALMAGSGEYADKNAKADFNAMYRYYDANRSIYGPTLMAWCQNGEYFNSFGEKLEDHLLKLDPLLDFGLKYYGEHENERLAEETRPAYLKNITPHRAAGMDPDSAIDGDFDIAYSLLLADAQWGSNGEINYRARAIAMIRDILQYETRILDEENRVTILLNGDWVMHNSEDKYKISTRLSDFILEEIVEFAEADPVNAGRWQAVYDTCHDIVMDQFENHPGSKVTGLMPDFSTAQFDSNNQLTHFAPADPFYLESEHDGDFYYNACRCPWRLSMSYLVYGDTAWQEYLQHLNNWIYQKTAGDLDKLYAGYYLNGTRIESYTDLCFTAPFGVSAMAGGFTEAQTWLDIHVIHLNSQMMQGDTQGETGNVYFGNVMKMVAYLVNARAWWVPSGGNLSHFNFRGRE